MLADLNVSSLAVEGKCGPVWEMNPMRLPG